MLMNGYQGFVPVNFLMKCQRLRDFGVGSAKGTFEAMMGAVECYLPQEDFLSKLVCFVADAASVNFGDISGALTAIAELKHGHCIKLLQLRLAWLLNDLPKLVGLCFKLTF